MSKKKKPVWLTIPDDEVVHIWADPAGKNEVEIEPTFYADSGTPVCDSNSKFDGEDMTYVRTEVSPRIAEALKFKATVEPVLQRIFDVLYFDGDKDCFDPDKEWDSAADFMDMMTEQLIALYGRPKARSKNYPDLKLKELK